MDFESILEEILSGRGQGNLNLSRGGLSFLRYLHCFVSSFPLICLVFVFTGSRVRLLFNFFVNPHCRTDFLNCCCCFFFKFVF